MKQGEGRILNEKNTRRPGVSAQTKQGCFALPRRCRQGDLNSDLECLNEQVTEAKKAISHVIIRVVTALHF